MAVTITGGERESAGMVPKRDLMAEVHGEHYDLVNGRRSMRMNADKQ
jgi:hypothetical protein